MAAFSFIAPAQFAEAAQLPVGDKIITLIAKDGSRKNIGRLTLKPDGDASRISVVLDSPDFTDEFLSMRPFRCLSGPKRMWCHLPYPYDLHGRISPTDLMDLEYALMFIWRTYDRVSADAWNGLYFKLAVGEDGVISGALHEADYNLLASPPAEKYSRPVSYTDLTPVLSSSQVWDKIEIR
ncbi:MAG: hypothetical protein CTY31_02445 [Hyphomicrobium sp.]|nr:MAG: hypothetical protein CTY39_06650 [Hyphomicrobium sp.]PPD01630.1 MAG: hypothetical protein CTY31_02445 [Hyphomicrobium sp.]